MEKSLRDALKHSGTSLFKKQSSDDSAKKAVYYFVCILVFSRSSCYHPSTTAKTDNFDNEALCIYIYLQSIKCSSYNTCQIMHSCLWLLPWNHHSVVFSLYTLYTWCVLLICSSLINIVTWDEIQESIHKQMSMCLVCKIKCFM